MSAGETISNAKAANTELEQGLRALNAATQSQEAFAESAHEVDRITGQMQTPLEYAMGHLATAATIAGRIRADSQVIKTLLEQLPTNEIYHIASPNDMVSGLADRVIEQVEGVHVPLSFCGEIITKLRAAFQEFKDPPDVKKTWASLHYTFVRIKQVIKRL